MHIKLIFEKRIETWETRADGNAATNHATLEVSSKQFAGHTSLMVWSQLKYQQTFDVLGNPINEDGSASEREEKGYPEEVWYIETRDLEKPVETLQGMFEAMGKHDGLLRFDVDGETFWQAEPTETVIDNDSEMVVL